MGKSCTFEWPIVLKNILNSSLSKRPQRIQKSSSYLFYLSTRNLKKLYLKTGTDYRLLPSDVHLVRTRRIWKLETEQEKGKRSSYMAFSSGERDQKWQTELWCLWHTLNGILPSTNYDKIDFLTYRDLLRACYSVRHGFSALLSTVTFIFFHAKRVTVK